MAEDNPSGSAIRPKMEVAEYSDNQDDTRVPFWDTVKKIRWIHEHPPDVTKIILYMKYRSDELEISTIPQLIAAPQPGPSAGYENFSFWEKVKKFHFNVGIPPGITQFVFYVERTVPEEKKPIPRRVSKISRSEARRIRPRCMHV